MVEPTTRPRALVVALTLLATLVAATSPVGAADGPARPDPRIVGGTVAPPGAWPSQVALVWRGHHPLDGQTCGGTVVDRSWILTAAHCVTDDAGRALAPTALDVLAGTQDLRRGGTRIVVREVRRHPSYDPATARNDIALLRLDRPVPAATPVQALAPAGTDPAPGTDVVAIGWGDLGDQTFPPELMQVTLDMSSPNACRTENGPTFVAASMVCARGTSRSACYGDSGGPLLVRRDGTWVQVGVTSWTWGCGEHDTVFARVSAFSTWIRWQVRYGPQPDAAAFVRRQHLDLFGREPTAAELFYGVAGLQDGQAVAAYVAGLLDGATYRGRAGGVARLYQAIFLRRPDSGGMTYWMGRAHQRASLGRIANQMVAAKEFVDRYGTLDDAAFVGLVYDNVLGRPASPDDLAFWTGELAAGRRTRGQVMVGFSESAEHRALTDATTHVVGTFHGLLRRVPDEEELGRWSGRPTLELARVLLTSHAYAARF